MLIQIRKSKIHKATVTDANLNYEGSVTIDEDLMDASNILAGERVQIVNNNNGERIETYVIKGERGSGTICLNGAAARKAEIGDIVIIISYAWLSVVEAKAFIPVTVHVNKKNNIKEIDAKSLL
jgi:aspartate 1-decarboxylase